MNRSIQQQLLKRFLNNRQWLIIAFMLLVSCSAFAQEEVRAEPDTTVTRTTIEVGPVESYQTDEPNYPFTTIDEMDSIRLQIRKVPDSVVRDLQNDDDFWYANADLEKKEDKQSRSVQRSRSDSPSWVSTVLLVLIIGVFLSLVVYYMAESGLFRRRRKIVVEESHNMEEMPEDIFAINYQKEIDTAIANGDYRLAVRLQYLRLLKQLTNRNLIRYEQDKTNMDYLMQLHNTACYHDFFRVTLHYEYSWYGQFAVSPQTYQLIMQDIQKLENKS